MASHSYTVVAERAENARNANVQQILKRTSNHQRSTQKPVLQIKRVKRKGTSQNGVQKICQRSTGDTG